MSTKTEQNQQLVRNYIDAGNSWPASKRDIAAWAISTGEWMPSRASLIAQCADELGRAMREELITDPQGRRVRAKHAATVGYGPSQQTLWADIRTAPQEHMATAFQQRRRAIVGDCRQLKLDVDSYNDNAKPVEHIQLAFDFTEDLAEIEALDALVTAHR